MLWQVVWLVLAISRPFPSARGIIVSWSSCPQIRLNDMSNYDCNLNVHPWVLSPLANVPGGASTLNPYHNPYPPVGCVAFEFYCRKESMTLGDLHYLALMPNSSVCPGFSVLLTKDSLKMQLSTNPESELCKTVVRWMTMDLFVYRQDEFVFMYGCHQADEGLPVHVGAWILVDRNASAAKRDRTLRMARKLALQIPGFSDDWWAYPRPGELCDGSGSCEYHANCVTSPDDELRALEPSSEPILTAYITGGALLLVCAIVAVRMLYKYVRVNRIEPSPAPPQVAPNE